jgi:F-type H+-transporting ATPase subunit epsilon
MQVDLVAVERQIWTGEAELVVARTTDGDIGIMSGHAPLLAELKKGFAARIVEPGGSVLGVAVHGGFLSVTKERVSILAESAELSDEIDIARARAAYETARAAGAETAEDLAALRFARAQLLATGQDV